MGRGRIYVVVNVTLQYKTQGKKIQDPLFKEKTV